MNAPKIIQLPTASESFDEAYAGAAFQGSAKAIEDADVVLNADGFMVKNRYGKERQATDEELAAAIQI